MRTRMLALAMLILCRVSMVEAQLYAVVSDEGGGPDVGSLLVLDPADGTIINRIPLTFASDPSDDGLVGIAAHPNTRVLYVIRDTDPRALATVNPATGIVTDIGSLGEYYSSLTFGSDGTLYAIAGANNNDDPAAVFTVNLSTAATTLFRASDAVLAGGFPDEGGMSIEINPADGRMYFSSTFGNDDLLRMNLVTKLASIVPTDDDVDAQAMTYEPASGTFLLWSDNGDEFFRVDPSTGAVTLLNTGVSEGNTIRGLELVPPPGQTAPAMGTWGFAVALLALFAIGYRKMAGVR